MLDSSFDSLGFLPCFPFSQYQMFWELFSGILDVVLAGFSDFHFQVGFLGNVSLVLTLISTDQFVLEATLWKMGKELRPSLLTSVLSVALQAACHS